jgi:TonB family protein
MPKPQTIVAALISIVALVSTCFLSAAAHAQQSSKSSPDELGRAVGLYEQGKDQEAIAALRQLVKVRKDDITAWHYLGLALNRQGKPNDARKAHEKAAKSGEKLLSSQFNSTTTESDFQAFIRQTRALLSDAADSADKYLELTGKPSRKRAEEWQARAEFLRDFAWLGERREGSAEPTIYTAKEVTTIPRILSRPEPQYTEEARKNRVTGVVVLRAVFAADGKIRAIRLLSGLPNGLTMMAIRAARGIKFIPAMKDGQPVSQYIQIEYNFNLY